MLLYITADVRAGIAALICIATVANLNYFEPHKNKILFWLSQISFVTTSAKYIMALLLASSTREKNQQGIMGSLLIALDVGFMISSILAIFMSLWMLRRKVRAINKKSREDRSVPLTQVQPINPAESENNGNDGGEVQGRRTWDERQTTDSMEVENLRAIRLKFGASSKEYTAALERVQEPTTTTNGRGKKK